MENDNDRNLGRRATIKSGVLCLTALLGVGTSTAGAQSEVTDPQTVDTTLTLDNQGASAWEVVDIEGERATAPLGEPNPTIELESGVRYEIENGGWSGHPLVLLDGNDTPLLTQSGTGTFEDDPAVDWVDTNETVAFTVTEELAAEIRNYRCGIHSSMEGAIEVTTADDGLSRFDQDNTGVISFSDVLDAIRAHNSDTQIGGEPVSFQDVLEVIKTHNNETPV